MQIDLTPEQDRYFREAIDSGQIEDEEHALQEAITYLMNKDLIEKLMQEILQVSKLLKDDPRFQELKDLISIAADTFALETTDDPFHAFDEWNGDADRQAYADL